MKKQKRIRIICLVSLAILITIIVYLNRGCLSDMSSTNKSLTCDPIQVIKDRFNVDLSGKAQVISYDYKVTGTDTGHFVAKLLLDKKHVDNIINEFDTQMSEHNCVLDDFKDIVSWWDLNDNTRIASYINYEGTDDLFGTDHKYMYTINMEVFVAKNDAGQYYMYVFIG